MNDLKTVLLVEGELVLENCVGNHTKCTNTIGSFVSEWDTDKHAAGEGVMNTDQTECIDFELCTDENKACDDFTTCKDSSGS